MLIDTSSLIKSIKIISGDAPKSLKSALKVNSLVKGSSADLAGIREGDYLLYVNNEPANIVDYPQMSARCIEVTYTFFSIRDKQYVEVNAMSAPLGASFIKTNETVYYEYTKDIERADYNDLYPIWNNRNWKALKKITDKAFIAIIMWMNCLAKNIEYCPEYLFSGAALYDSGKRKKGMSRIKCFYDAFSDSLSQEEDSIVKYYYAREMLKNNERKAAIELMQEAYMQGRHERIAKELFKLTGEKPVYNDYWPGREFPYDYYLKQAIYSDGGWVKLSATLQAMDSDQLLIICMLANFRTNIFYDRFMHRLIGYANCFPGVIFDLHVIISNVLGSNHDYPELLEHEVQYAKRNNSISVLLDTDEQLWDALEPHGSPTIYVLDKKGIVLHEGELFENDLWDVLLGKP